MTQSDQKIVELEKEIQRLQQQISDLTWQVRRLTVCKTDDPKYPYWNWLLERNISEEKVMLLENIMRILGMRFEKQEIPTMMKKIIPGLSVDLLYRSEIPNYEEVEHLLSSVLGINKKMIPNLLQSMMDQGYMVAFCSHILAERTG